MTESSNTFDENLELAKSLTASVWERLGYLGISKEWDESKHPRGAGGKFGSGGSSERSPSQKAQDASRHAASFTDRRGTAFTRESGKAHADAAVAHASAAREADRAGRPNLAEYHAQRSAMHADAVGNGDSKQSDISRSDKAADSVVKLNQFNADYSETTKLPRG